jgi:hypothetical protein
MKKHIVLAVVVSIIALGTLACSTSDIGPRLGIKTIHGSGDVVTQDRDVSDFHAIALSGIGNVSIRVGDEESLQVEAEDNLLPYLETVVRGETLQIGIQDGVTLNPTQSINFYVTLEELNSIDVSGLGNVEAGSVSAARFSIAVSGGGDVDIESLESDTLAVDLSGLGNVRIDEGKVENQSIEISGGGDYEARGLESDTTDVHLSGLGSVTIRVHDHLEVDISGGGTIQYLGDPTIEKSISGLGSISKMDE